MILSSPYTSLLYTVPLGEYMHSTFCAASLNMSGKTAGNSPSTRAPDIRVRDPEEF